MRWAFTRCLPRRRKRATSPHCGPSWSSGRVTRSWWRWARLGWIFFVPALTTPAARTRQAWFYAQQVHLARELALPVIVHVRQSSDALLKVLRATPVISGIAHAFNGSLQQAQAFTALNFKLGLGGAISPYPGAQAARSGPAPPLEAWCWRPIHPTCPRSGSTAPPPSVPLASPKGATPAPGLAHCPGAGRLARPAAGRLGTGHHRQRPRGAAGACPLAPKINPISIPFHPVPPLRYAEEFRRAGEQTSAQQLLNKPLADKKMSKERMPPMPRFKPLHAALLSVAFLGGAAGVAGWEHLSPPLAAAQAQAPAANPLLVQGLPDFSPLVGRCRRPLGGEYPHHGKSHPPRGGVPGFPGMDPDMLEFFRRFGLPVPNMPPSNAPAPRAMRAAMTSRASPGGVGLGLYPEQRWLHHDQRPRGRGCQRGHGHPGRQARIQGQNRRGRQTHRRGRGRKSTPRACPPSKWAMSIA